MPKRLKALAAQASFSGLLNGFQTEAQGLAAHSTRDCFPGSLVFPNSLPQKGRKFREPRQPLQLPQLVTLLI